MRKPARGEQPASESAQPIRSAAGEWLRGGDAEMTDPTEAVVIVKGIGDVHRPVDHDLVSQPCSGIDPRNTHTPSRTVVKHRGFYSAKLGDIGYLVMPGLLLQDVVLQWFLLTASGGYFCIQPAWAGQREPERRAGPYAFRLPYRCR